MMQRTTPISRRAAAVVALVAWAGLAAQLVATTGETGSLAAALWNVLRYFTIIANLLIAIGFGAVAGRGAMLPPARMAGLALAILLVGVVNFLFLRGLRELDGIVWIADRLLHYVTPVLVPLYWLAFVRKGSLRRAHIARWLLFPAAYLVYAFARAAYDGIYAYPFIDVADLGWAQVAQNAAVMALAFAIAGYTLFRLDHRLRVERVKGIEPSS